MSNKPIKRDTAISRVGFTACLTSQNEKSTAPPQLPKTTKRKYIKMYGSFKLNSII